MGREVRRADAKTVDVAPPVDVDPLRRASPSVDDMEGRRARASIAAKLFSGPAKPIRVGRYRIGTRIGAGGMGVVYRAHDPELARDIAVKVVNPNSDGQDPTHAQARLVREARAMAKLAHPNVIHVYDVGTVDEGVFIAMELVEGQSLAQWIADGPHAWRDTLRYFVDAGRGLAAAHAAGVIHRDFKPHNVLLGHDGRVRVGDFGLAGGESAGPTGQLPALPPDADEKAVLDRASVSGTLTRTGMLLGTPKYMSPEQEAGGIASTSSDQFSFCVALYEALYGRPPFAGDSVDLYRENVRCGRVLPPPIDTRVRAWVHTEIVRGLQVDPDDRHPDMAALLDRLEGALEDPSAARRRRRRLRMALFGGLAAGTVGLALWGFGLPSPRVEPPTVVTAPAPAPPPADASEPRTVAVPVPVATPGPTSDGGAQAAVATGTGRPATEPADTAETTSAERPTSPSGRTDKGGKARVKRAPKGRGACFFREYNQKLIKRERRAAAFVSDKRGKCWDCTLPATAGVQAGLNPSDCAEYYMCHAADSAESCSD